MRQVRPRRDEERGAGRVRVEKVHVVAVSLLSARQAQKKWKAEHNRWRLPSEGREADMNPSVIERADRISYQSRVTYLEANLMRHLRKERPGQLESNAASEYIEKYREVSSDDILPYIFDVVMALFAKFPPMRKSDAGIVPVPTQDMCWHAKKKKE